jgi:hypothetical protein
LYLKPNVSFRQTERQLSANRTSAFGKPNVSFRQTERQLSANRTSAFGKKPTAPQLL